MDEFENLSPIPLNENEDENSEQEEEINDFFKLLSYAELDKQYDREFRDEDNPVTCIDWSPVSNKIVAGTYFGKIKIWNINSRLFRNTETKLRDLEAEAIFWLRPTVETPRPSLFGQTIKVVWSKSGQSFLAFNNEFELFHVNYEDADNIYVSKNLFVSDQEIEDIVWCDDERYVLILTNSRQLFILDIESDNKIVYEHYFERPIDNIYCIKLSPDKTKIAMFGKEKYKKTSRPFITIFDGTNVNVNRRGMTELNHIIPYINDELDPKVFQWVSDNTNILLLSKNRQKTPSILYINTDTGVLGIFLTRRYSKPSNVIELIACGPDKRIVASYDEYNIVVYDTLDKTNTYEITHHTPANMDYPPVPCALWISNKVIVCNDDIGIRVNKVVYNDNYKNYLEHYSNIFTVDEKYFYIQNIFKIEYIFNMIKTVLALYLLNERDKPLYSSKQINEFFNTIESEIKRGAKEIKSEILKNDDKNIEQLSDAVNTFAQTILEERLINGIPSVIPDNVDFNDLRYDIYHKSWFVASGLEEQDDVVNNIYFDEDDNNTESENEERDDEQRNVQHGRHRAMERNEIIEDEEEGGIIVERIPDDVDSEDDEFDIGLGHIPVFDD